MSEPVSGSIELSGDGLLLRPYRPEDSRELVAAVRESVASVGAWLPWCHAGYGDAEADAWIAHCGDAWRSGEHFAFAVFEGMTGQFLGAAGLNQRNREHNFMNLGYWVRTSRAGHGVASAAARLCARFAFAELGFGRAEIVVIRANLASCRAAEKSGARFEGFLRNRLYLHGDWHEAAMYSFVPGDLA